MSVVTSDIGTFETCRRTVTMSDHWSKEEVVRTRLNRRD